MVGNIYVIIIYFFKLFHLLFLFQQLICFFHVGFLIFVVVDGWWLYHIKRRNHGGKYGNIKKGQISNYYGTYVLLKSRLSGSISLTIIVIECMIQHGTILYQVYTGYLFNFVQKPYEKLQIFEKSLFFLVTLSNMKMSSKFFAPVNLGIDALGFRSINSPTFTTRLIIVAFLVPMWENAIVNVQTLIIWVLYWWYLKIAQ